MWKLVSFGDQRMGLDSAEQVIIRAAWSGEAGSFSTPIEKAFLRTDDDLWRAFSFVHTGDSIAFRSVSPDFLRPDHAGSDTLNYQIGILKMRTKRQLEDARLRELAGLDALVRSDTVRKHYTEHEGVWFRSVEPGDTALVRPQREVLIQYQGRLENGQVFDDSRRQQGPLRFVMGQEHQVLPGIELGLQRMHRGEVAELIIPSWLAFGSQGSIGGAVPPYTTVRYTLEVVELAKD
jgi:FKBP-type peptidyl-prolyl cis-trans isomerase